VNGEIVVSRKGGLMAKLLKRGWPTTEEVVAAVRAAARTPRPSGGAADVA